MLHRSLLALLLAGPALASTAIQMDLPALTRAASDVVRARVTGTRSAWTEDHRRIVTLVEMDVLETWKGAPKTRLTVLQLGGEIDGIGQAVSGVASLEPGQEVVVFIERQGPVHRVVGLAQGVYRVERQTAAEGARAVPAALDGLELVTPPGGPLQPRRALPLTGLRDEVRKAAGRP
jgi:hypothetical protein